MFCFVLIFMYISGYFFQKWLFYMALWKKDTLIENFRVNDKKLLCLCPLLQRTCLGKIAKTFILDEIKIWAYQNVLSTYRQCVCNLNQLNSAKKLFLKGFFLAKFSNNSIFLVQSFFHLRHVADSSGISSVDNRTQNWVFEVWFKTGLMSD